jgi:hypothetical protein
MGPRYGSYGRQFHENENEGKIQRACTHFTIYAVHEAEAYQTSRYFAFSRIPDFQQSPR